MIQRPDRGRPTKPVWVMGPCRTGYKREVGGTRARTQERDVDTPPPPTDRGDPASDRKTQLPSPAITTTTSSPPFSLPRPQEVAAASRAHPRRRRRRTDPTATMESNGDLHKLSDSIPLDLPLADPNGLIVWALKQEAR